MANLSVEEPYALMRARTGLWEPWAGNCPGPPGLVAPPRQRHQPAAANISSTSVDGSGTAANSGSADGTVAPLSREDARPKLARQMVSLSSNVAGLAPDYMVGGVDGARDK